MMGATQPFISGAISKTVNVPKDATVDEIMEAYVESWRLGAKAISIYRDGSKRTQPLNTSKDKVSVAAQPAVTSQPVRRKLPDERQAITHKFDIAGHEGYVTVGLFEDGAPGEIFLVMAKEGSTISGFADAFAQAISYALQYGVPLQVLVDKFSHVRFEPSDTRRTRHPHCQVDCRLFVRWMATKFLSPEAQYRAGEHARGQWGRDRECGTESGPDSGPERVVDRIGDGPSDDSESGRRTAVPNVRFHHDSQRCLLQMRQLWHDQRVRVANDVRAARPRAAFPSSRRR